MNAITIIILVILGVLVALALKRMRKKGTCECTGCSVDGAGCQNCGAVDKMIADMENSAKKDVVQ